jgi:hypothetical protein
MPKELKNISENQKARNDTFASVVRSFGEVNNRFHTLAAESVGRAVEIQSHIISKAYETYISEISKLGRMFFDGYGNLTTRPLELSHANLNERKARDKHQDALAEAKVSQKPARQRTAAQSVATKGKTGTVSKRRSGAKRSARAKR